MGKTLTRISKNEMDTYGKAGAMAEEVLAAIRTVTAFGGQQKEVDRFATELKLAERNGIIRGALTGVTMGLMFGMMYCIYGFGFWYGVKIFADDRDKESFQTCAVGCLSEDTSAGEIFDCINNCFRFDPGTISTALFGILQGGMQIGQSATFAEAFNTARAAAASIYQVIDRQSEIDSLSFEGIHLENITGNISFKNVFFNYPARKDVPVLQGLTLDIKEGKCVALVGSSGCGKSTCIQLIQRFYDPDFGTVEVDGIDVKQLNIGSLRDNIGIVGQEPVLFDCTIKQNISYANPAASDDEIVEACKQANAYNFIMKLPKQLDTMVGEGGAQLSGGQKQRIAIARALVRNPKILLLDEATSALDNESEGVVQAALDRAQSGRTTIIVAHRLTTIKNADEIIAIEKGEVKERGTHSELMKLKGLYHSLVTRQMAEKTENDSVAENSKNEHIEAKLAKQVSTSQDHVEIEEIIRKDKVKASNKPLLFFRLAKLNSPEWFFVTVGIIAATGFGAVNVFFAIIFGDVLTVFSETDTTIARDKSVDYALQFCALGLVCLVSIGLQGLMFGISGERLTKRVRILMFQAMLKQEMGWYDSQENNTGALCARLSSNAQAVSGATGAKVGQIMQGIATLFCSLGLALYYNWKVGLVSFAFIPLLIVGMVLQMLLIIKQGSVQVTALEKSSKFAVEAITNIRTVAGLRCEKMFQERYNAELVKPYKKTKNQAHVRGLIFGFANSSFAFAYAVTFLYGGHIYIKERTPEEVMEIWKIAIAVLNGAMFIGLSFSFVMDFNLAFAAADAIFKLLDRRPLIDDNPSAGLMLPDINSDIHFTDAVFSYPTRSGVKVLRSLSIALKKGQKIALVGQSGCGKSTIIQLIQRLYDLNEGTLNIGSEEIRQLNVPSVRSGLGLVSQEPVLFNRSVADNIKYGDNSREVSMEEVMTAARKEGYKPFHKHDKIF
jgi:ABC-type multidrug transport system fused ATPase/permease subunit